jgi:hypothetical protein
MLERYAAPARMQVFEEVSHVVWKECVADLLTLLSLRAIRLGHGRSYHGHGNVDRFRCWRPHTLLNSICSSSPVYSSVSATIRQGFGLNFFDSTDALFVKSLSCQQPKERQPPHVTSQERRALLHIQ